MKNLVFLLAFFICVSTKAQYNPALHTVTNKPLGIAQAVPTDARSFYYDPALFTYRPYMSTAEVLAYLNISKYRVGNFPIFINVGGTLQSNGTFTGGTIQEYWFKDGTANTDLLLKTTGGTTTTITTILDSARFTNRFRNLGTPTFPLIDLNPPGIIPGTYLNPVVTVDSFRVISIANGGSYGTGIPDRILTGGYVAWGTGLTYNVTAATYDKNYKPYSSPYTSVTLAAADPTLDRIDKVVVDTNNQVVVITGIPAVNPIAPQENLSSQLTLTTITVKANTTSPTNVFITTIHDENNTGEWNGNGFGISPNFATTVTPAHLFKAVSIPSWSDGNAITFSNGATVALNNYTALTGYIKLDAAIPSTANIAVAFLNDQNQITQAVTLTNPLGFDKNIVGVYQPFIVPMGNFIFQSGYLGNTLKFFLTGTSVTGLEMDFIQLQAGSINNGSSPYVTDAFLQNDSLFVNKNNINTFRGLVTGLGGGGTTNAYTKPQTDSAIAANKLVQVNSDWNATSGIPQILNKPTIPTTTSQLTNNSGFITSTALSPYLTSANAASTYQPIGNYLTNITGLITQGSNITITGSGTSGSPYVINSTSSGTTLDTTSLSNRINNAVVRFTETADSTAWIAHYPNGRADTLVPPSYSNQNITLSGDVTGSGSTGITTTLATVNSGGGTVGSSTQIPIITYNAKGLITGSTTATISAGGTSSQWVTQNNDIYYQTGNVAIGSSSTPSGLLSLTASSLGANPGIKTGLSLRNSTPATSGLSQASPPLRFQANAWTGTASDTTGYQMYASPNGSNSILQFQFISTTGAAASIMNLDNYGDLTAAGEFISNAGGIQSFGSASSQFNGGVRLVGATTTRYITFSSVSAIAAESGTSNVLVRVNGASDAGTGSVALAVQNLTGDVSINSSSYDNSALLNVVSTGKGVLIPRMTAAQRDAINLTMTGLNITPGTGYTGTATATITTPYGSVAGGIGLTVSGGGISSGTISNAGSYNAVPTVTVTGTGTGAVVTPIMTQVLPDGLMIHCTDCIAADGSTGVTEEWQSSTSSWKRHF